MNTQLPPNIAIVILNWNGGDDTLACLDSLTALTYPNFNVIVVDNGSTDDSPKALRAYSSLYPLVLLETGRNLGYAGGNNVGTHYALEHGADFVLILNNDTTVAPDLLDQLVEASRRNPDAGVFSARIMYMDEPDRIQFDGARWNADDLSMEWPGQGQPESARPPDDHKTDYACGASLFFRVEVANQIGLLDERFFLTWEETDWCFRARKAGWDCLVIPAAKIWHKTGVSFGGEDSPLRIYFSVRNKLLWVKLHVSVWGQLRLWTKTLRLLIPKFFISADTQTPMLKRLLWAAHDYTRAWLGRGSRLEYLATRRAIMDYVHRRLGDCPGEVRAWSKVWSALPKS